MELEPISLKWLADQLASLATAMKKIADSVAHVTQLGTKGYDEIVARRTYAQLLDLRRNLELLHARHNAPQLNILEEFLAFAETRPNESLTESQIWKRLIENAENTRLKANEIANDMSKQRNDFVLEQAFREIDTTLQGRISVLDKITSKAELNAVDAKDLKHFAREYRNLVTESHRASDSLAKYIKTLGR